jgi:hypothetical protein
MAQVLVAMSRSTISSAVCSCAFACSTPWASLCPVADDLPRPLVHIEVEEPVAQARLVGDIWIGRQKLGPTRIVPVEILDDEARLWDRSIPRAVTQHRELADRPELSQCGG